MNQSAASLVGMEMIYELCTKAATFITDRHLDSARGKQASFQDQRRKREEEEAKVRIYAWLHLYYMVNDIRGLYRSRKKRRRKRNNGKSSKKQKKQLGSPNSSRRMFARRRS